MPKLSARAQWAAHLRGGSTGKSSNQPVSVTLSGAPFKGIVLGIDPSLRGTGLAIIEFPGTGESLYIASETVNPKRGSNLPECLGEIARAVERFIDRYAPVNIAVEETIYVQNFRTAQKLGAARGAAIGEAARRQLPVFEYSPLRIKQAVVGYGRASKEQVARQMSGLLGLKTELAFDEADAAAVAVCHAFTHGRTLTLG